MATSSRRFQSQTVARLVTGYRQLTQGTGHWLRRGRTAAVWGLQVAIYPLYAAVQGLRVGYRRLQAARPWPPVRARLTGRRPAAQVAPDLPIRALLSVVQPPGMSSALVRLGGLRLVNVYGQWLQQSQAGAVLTPGQWQLVPWQAQIRGIASDLGDRRLVLVTVDNDIFADLTADQEQRLQRAIVLMLAEYARLDRRLAGDRRLRQPGLPLPQANPALLPPLRWLPPLVRWMQTSPLAAATNLFGEASLGLAQTHARRRERPLGLSPVLPRSTPQPEVKISQSVYSSSRSLSAAGDRPILLASVSLTTSLDRMVELVVATSRAGVAALPSPTDKAEAVSVLPGSRPMAQPETPEPVPPVMVEGDIVVLAAPEQAAPDPAVPYLLDSRPGGNGHLSVASGVETLEAQVVQVGYVDSPLVLVLRGLDWMLFAIETRLRLFWAWLRRQR
jgi:hypothetical protein